MKKLKLFVSVLLGSLMILPALSGCAGNESGEVATPTIFSVKLDQQDKTVFVDDQFSVKATVTGANNPTQKVEWSVLSDYVTITEQTDNTCKIAAVSKGTAYLKATSVDDPSKFSSIQIKVVEPSVTKVDIVEDSLTIGVDREETATVTVTTAGNATKDVIWSLPSGDIATIKSSDNNSCTVIGVAPGRTVLTCTSRADNSKVDRIEINVLDLLWQPEFYDDGYNISKSFPELEIREFLGEGSHFVFTPSGEFMDDGFYWYNNPADGTYAAYFEVILNIHANVNDEESITVFMNQIDALITEAEDLGMYYFYDSNYYIDCLIDPTSTYEVDVMQFANAAETDYYVNLCFYKTEDLYASNTLTTDTDWNVSTKTVISSALGTDVVVPFVALGSDYKAEVDEENGGIIIYDYSCCFNALKDYGDTLEALGYVWSEGASAWIKPLTDDPMETEALYIMFGFSGGNMINAFVFDRVFHEWPTALVNNYTENVIGTTIVVTPFLEVDPEDEVRFRTYENDEYLGTCAEVSILDITEDEFDSYAVDFYVAGYTPVSYQPYDEEEGTVPSYTFTLNDVMVLLTLEPQVEIDWDTWSMTYDFDHSTLYVDIYSLKPTIEIADGDLELSVGDSPVTLAVSGENLPDGATVSFESSNESVATVSAQGVVTPVAAGTATITASYGDVTDSITVTVSEAQMTEQTVNWAVADIWADVAPAAGSGIDFTSKTYNGFAFSASLDAGQSKPMVYQENTGGKFTARLYAKNTLTITAGEGETLEEITLNLISGNGGKTQATISANTGSVNGLTWTGEANSVTFTIGASGQLRIESFTIKYIGKTGGDIPEPTGKTVAEECADICLNVVSNIFTGITADDIDVTEGNDLTYAEFYTFLTDYSVDDVAAIVNSCIPEEYPLDSSNSFYKEGTYYDMWYTDGEYYVAAYIEDYTSYGYDGYVLVQIDVFPVSQALAYISAMY